MQQNFSKNTSEYHWTRHAAFKMRQHGLTEQRIKRVIKNPKRKEEGVAKDTVAVMQPVSVKTVVGKEIWKQEIWVMYMRVARSCKLKIISAWRYPGVSPEKNPIPEEVWQELEDVG